MPILTIERRCEGKVTTTALRRGESPFFLTPGEAARMLGISPEAVKYQTVGDPRKEGPCSPTSVGDDSLLKLAAQLTTREKFLGYVEPGVRNLIPHPNDPQVMIYKFTTPESLRIMVLHIPSSNQRQA